MNEDSKNKEEKLAQESKEQKKEEQKEYSPSELAELKSKLNDLNEKKEKWFARKEELKVSIANLIKQVQAVKAKNDTFTDSIKGLKDKRDQQNLEVKKLIVKIKELGGSGSSKKNIDPKKKVSPRMLKDKIDQLKTQIETGGVSFDQEKKLMKQIKSLKKEYEEIKGSTQADDNSKELSKKIDDAKIVAKDLHDKVTQTAKNNREGYKSFMALSKEINKVKKEQEDAFDKFIKFKQEFADLNKVLKRFLESKGQVVKKYKKKKEKREKEKKIQQEKKLEEKKEKVEEKIKKRKILTTEDLIAFQGNSN
jgi:uncharacterized coiled-coil DUF342 family protein